MNNELLQHESMFDDKVEVDFIWDRMRYKF